MEHLTSWKKDKWLIVGASFMTVLALLFSALYYYMLQHMVTRYHVWVGTERVGVVSSPGIVEEWLRLKQEQVKQQNPEVQTNVLIGDLHYITEQAYKATYDNEAIKSALEQKIRIVLSGIQIRIDGKPLGQVKDESSALQLLEQYKRKFASGEDVVSAEFTQNIELAPVALNAGQISGNEELLDKIEAGAAQPIRYQVQKGDCLSCIAHKFHVTQQTIYELNPSLKGTLIRAGDELILSEIQPLLTVKTVQKRTETKEIPFDTQYVDEPELKEGTKQVMTLGENGLKQTTYLTTRMNGKWVEEQAENETIVRPAVQALVKRGTKVIPGVGTGSFAWPVYQAKLTSEYGKRWGTFHPGTDMVSEQSAILAADRGKVIFAGWKSGYGNCIIIDHQNGYSTLYGHMSQILVSDKEAVEKGEKIGIMGRTGNATGVHLHFEVRVGERQENPLRFLRPSAE
ncbi:hypothetical protein CF651_02675 [Paenibacillus rigui]|uniref:Peptidase M23 n=1 Tax=Paenibacillus rigui TaxID=554312 RepID=A0A229UX14_9BACL|nr:M23 family metallopeptidase [Paenibacillus rigui]OXM88016.1 hypothetical protein CF651_02675 [Paenibacillus rigui]